MVEIDPEYDDLDDALQSAIAVVGIGCYLPGAPDVDAFWKLLVDGKSAATRFSAEQLSAAGISEKTIANPAFVPVRACVDDPLLFDAGFFAMRPAEAARTDPQHRIFLQTAWHALEDAGCDPATFDGPIGVYAGCNPSSYRHVAGASTGVLDGDVVASAIAVEPDYLATRVAYKLNLRGPALDVQTACSTSLVAVQLAVQSLLAGQCDLALAGGVAVAIPGAGGHFHGPGSVMSSDGTCRAFDAAADGCFSGDGAGIVALRRLDDALAAGDPIRAIIRGAATNNDGSAKIGYTAPSIDGQADVIDVALALADVDADSVGMIEAHGTGTALGDPIEVAALRRAFAETTDRRGFCALGAVKTNIGHLGAAAGVAGLIKAVLAVQHARIPPSLNFQTANPQLELATSPFYVPTELCEWPAVLQPRRAGVSSFGVGGTNAHVVIEQAPPSSAQSESSLSSPRRTATTGADVFTLTAKTASALDATARRLAHHLDSSAAAGNAPGLDDIGATLGRRAVFSHRRTVVAADHTSLIAGLQRSRDGIFFDGIAASSPPAWVFAFGPQGGLRRGMGHGLAQIDKVFATALHEGLTAFSDHTGTDLRPYIDVTRSCELDAGAPIIEQQIATPITFAIGRALATWWRSRGVSPAAWIGHSIGEYIAGHLTGAFSLDAIARLLAVRGRAIATLPAGAAMICPVSAAVIAPLLSDDVFIAVDNGAVGVMVAGAPSAIARFADRAEREGIVGRRFAIPAAPHCPLMEPILPAVLDVAATMELSVPTEPLFSCRLGAELDATNAVDPDHWARVSTDPVRFGAALGATVAAIGKDRRAALIELGSPRSIVPLSGAVSPPLQCLPSLPTFDHAAATDPTAASRFAALTDAARWNVGGRDRPAVPEGRVVSLPGYAFDLLSHGRLVAAPTAQSPPANSRDSAPNASIEDRVAAIAAELIGVARVEPTDDFFALGADSLVTLRLVARVQREFGIELPASVAFAGMNVARLSAAIQRQVGSSQAGPFQAVPTRDLADEHACLVPLRPTGERPPLFMVHPAAGVVFPFFELARAMGDDQPFYALQAEGLDGNRPPDVSVEAMATRYLAAIRTVQPDGPIRIAGYSFGCYVAFEMALQLQERGERAAFVGLLDESAPLDGHRPSISLMGRLFLGRAGSTFRRHLHDYLYLAGGDRQSNGGSGHNGSSGSSGSSGDTRTTGRWNRFLERSTMAALLPDEARDGAVGDAAMAAMFRLFVLHTQLCFSYQPRGNIACHATLFLSDWTVKRPRWTGLVRDPTLGWGKLVDGGVRTRRVTGDHLAIVRRPHVDTLARQLRLELDRRTDSSRVRGVADPAPP